MDTRVAPPPVVLDLEADEIREAPFSEYRHRRWWNRRSFPLELWRYIALETARIAFLSIVSISLFYAALTAYQTVRSGVQVAYIWPFLAKTVAYPLYFSIPLSVLFGLTLSMGRMVADLEISAMRCHGASHAQIYAPVLALGIVAAGASHWVNGWVIPELRYERRNLEQYVLRQLENLGTGRNRAIPLPDGGGTLLVGAYEGTSLWKVEIDLNRKLQSRFVPEVRDQLPDRLPETITLLARMGRLEIRDDSPGVVIHLRGVEVLVPEKGPLGDRFYQRFSITENLMIPISFEPKTRGFKDLVRPDLATYLASLEKKCESSSGDEDDRRELTAARAEWHRRDAFTISSILFPLLGASLCFVLDRRNRLVPFLVGNLLILGLFYPLLMVGASLAERGLWPWLALCLPNIALLALTAFLLRRVLRQ